MFRLNSSLRERRPEESVRHAKELATRLGISRVTDTTRLDKIGIPVFASIRPMAQPGSLCVSAGKGLDPAEARIGAYMEAIELATAEPTRANVAVHLASARDVLDGNERPSAVLDFCPIARRSVDPAAPLACVMAQDLVGHADTLVPAELVLLPYVGRPGTGHFGSHSNGLASGNSIAEATLHGLLEVVERDVRSFHHVADRSRVVQSTTLPSRAQELIAKVHEADLDLVVRSQSNPYDIPVFQALLYDRHATGPYAFAVGYGCHLVAEIAVIRAIAEAAQSRLSWIHGGRDDLEADADAFSARLNDRGRWALREAFSRLQGAGEVTTFEEAFTRAPDPSSIDAALDEIINRLVQHGVRFVCRTILTDPSDSLYVVRIIVPTLEYLDHGSHRVGPRLHRFIRQHAP